MSQAAPAFYPLIGRAPGDVMFRSLGHAVTADTFLRRAHALAAALPPGRHTVNLCQDRVNFALVTTALLLRNQVMLLTGDRSPARIDRLRHDFAAVTTIDDAEVETVGLDRAAADLANPVANPLVPADRLAALVFTSGTTGEPIAHQKSFGALVQRARAMRDLFAPDGSTILGTIPPQHMYGFETTILLPLHGPVAVSCASAFYHADIALALESIEASRILVTTPMQLRLLLDAGTALPPLTRIISATAPMPPDLAAAAEDRFATELHEIYGATEIGSAARRRTTDGPLWQVFPGLRVSPGADQVEVTAPHAIPTPLNDEIVLEGPDEFRLLGRKADMVKLAGKRASLAGLTRILTGIEGVHDGLFVAPDDLEVRPSARLLAYVVAPGRSSAAILADLRRLVEPAFLPRRVVCVDGLPRNELGKLPRHALAALRDRAGLTAMTSPAPIKGFFRINGNHPALPGHFPGRPVVPGVVLLDEILGIIHPHLPSGSVADGFDAVKFLAPVLPDQQVIVQAQLAGATAHFSASVDAIPVLRGTARFADAT